MSQVMTNMAQVCNNYSLQLQMPHFIEMLLTLVFQSGIDKSTQYLYLMILQSMIANSVRNAILFRNSELSERLIFYLRLER